MNDLKLLIFHATLQCGHAHCAGYVRYLPLMLLTSCFPVGDPSVGVLIAFVAKLFLEEAPESSSSSAFFFSVVCV